MSKDSRLIRKQVLLEQDQVTKLERIAAKHGISLAKAVRQAIDAYDPDNRLGMEDSELANYVALQVKEALKATRRANRQIKSTLHALDDLEGAA